MTRRTHRPRRDEALITARELLDGCVCECGHYDSEHAFDREGTVDRCEDDCSCKQFRAVVFRVERA